MNQKHQQPWRAIALFLLVSAVVLATFILWGERIDAWTQEAVAKAADDRALVAAILFLVLASDILLPVPSSLASTACGLVLGLALGFAVSFLAMSASAAAGYVLGRFATGAATRIVGASEMAALREFQRRTGPWTLLALRPVPVLAEASAVFAGIGRLPVGSTTLQLALGNAAVSFVYVFIGAFSVDTDRGAWLAFLAAMAVSGLFFLIRPSATCNGSRRTGWRT